MLQDRCSYLFNFNFNDFMMVNISGPPNGAMLMESANIRINKCQALKHQGKFDAEVSTASGEIKGYIARKMITKI